MPIGWRKAANLCKRRFSVIPGKLQDGTLAVALDGRPRTVNNAATGGQAQVRNNSAELIFGIGMLLVAVAIAIVMVQRWQNNLPRPRVTGTCSKLPTSTTHIPAVTSVATTIKSSAKRSKAIEKCGTNSCRLCFGYWLSLSYGQIFS